MGTGVDLVEICVDSSDMSNACNFLQAVCRPKHINYQNPNVGDRPRCRMQMRLSAVHEKHYDTMLNVYVASACYNTYVFVRAPPYLY